MTDLFPMFVKLAGRRCLVVGAGRIAEPKIRSLLNTGARIDVVAIKANEAVREWANEGTLCLHLREFVADDLKETFLVVAATRSRGLNESIYHEAQRRGALCNVVDDPAHCDFYYPAVVRRGALQIAVSTGGKSPSLAQKLRQQLEKQFSPAYARWVEELGETRQLVLASELDAERKRELLSSLAARPAFEAAIAEQAWNNEGENA